MRNIEELAQKVSNAAYAAVAKHFEEAEHAGLIVGNGHHMAQDIAEKAKNLLLERHQKILPGGGSPAAGERVRLCEEECCLPK